MCGVMLSLYLCMRALGGQSLTPPPGEAPQRLPLTTPNGAASENTKAACGACKVVAAGGVVSVADDATAADAGVSASDVVAVEVLMSLLLQMSLFVLFAVAVCLCVVCCCCLCCLRMLLCRCRCHICTTIESTTFFTGVSFVVACVFLLAEVFSFRCFCVCSALGVGLSGFF